MSVKVRSRETYQHHCELFRCIARIFFGGLGFRVLGVFRV